MTMLIKHNQVESLSELQFLYDCIDERYYGIDNDLPYALLQRPDTVVPKSWTLQSPYQLASFIDWAFYGNTKQERINLYSQQNAYVLDPTKPKFDFRDLGQGRVADTTYGLMMIYPYSTYIKEDNFQRSDFVYGGRFVRYYNPILNMWKDLQMCQDRMLMSLRRDGLVSSYTRTRHLSNGTTETRTYTNLSLSGPFWPETFYRKNTDYGGNVTYEYVDTLQLQSSFKPIIEGTALLIFTITCAEILTWPHTFLYPVELTPTDTGFEYPTSKFNRETWEDLISRAGLSSAGSVTVEFRHAFYDLKINFTQKIEEETNP